MFVVVTARFRLLYVVVVLGYEQRNVIHINVTPNSTRGRLARQITKVSLGHCAATATTMLWPQPPVQRIPPAWAACTLKI